MYSVQPRHDGQAFDLAMQIGLQECTVVPEGHTSIAFAVRAEHESVRKETCPPMDVAAANGNKAQCLHPVEKLSPELKVIDTGGVAPRILSLT